jgi:O-antigen/teichoic acid export membrane protein
MRLSDRFRTTVLNVRFGESLKARAFRGGAWLGFGSFSEQVVRFARNIVLARLLAPEAFGTMAIILSATSLLHTITDIGVKDAIIQNPKGTENRYVNAAFWMTFGRSLLLSVLIFVLAPWLAAFYGNAALTAFLRVASVTVLIDGSVSPKVYVALKHLTFSRWAAINHGGGILGVLLTIVASFFIRNVWALVLGAAAESLSRTALSHIFFPFFPSLSMDREALRDLLRFSRGLFGLSFLNLIFARTDIFILAKLLPAAELGVYVLAVNLVQTPASFLINLLGQTLMPALSHVQGDNRRMNRILLRVTLLLCLGGLPLLVFFYFCGHSVLVLAYGARYTAAKLTLIFAAAAMLANVLNAQITTVFYAKGRPQLHRRSVAMMATLMIALTYPLTVIFGMVGGQIACLASVVLGYAFQVWRLKGLTDISLKDYGSSFLFALGTSSIVALICLATRFFSIFERPVANVVVGILACLLGYCLSIMYFSRALLGDQQQVGMEAMQ